MLKVIDYQPSMSVLSEAAYYTPYDDPTLPMHRQEQEYNEEKHKGKKSPPEWIKSKENQKYIL